MTQHKWHKEIKAWADGAEIESRYIVDVEFKELKEWGNDCSPFFDDDDKEFRIKPQPKEPQYLYVFRNPRSGEFMLSEYDSRGSVGKIKLEE